MSAPNKSIFSFLKFERIKDKLVLIVLTSILIISVVAVLVVLQNTTTSRTLNKISDLRIPVPIITSDIMSGANRVSASQRAYMMTGISKYESERLNIWKTQILPAAENLLELKKYMEVQEHIEIVDETYKMVLEYQGLQDEIDTFFERNLRDYKLDYGINDSTSYQNLVAQLNMKAQLESELDSLVAGEASRVRAELRNTVLPLNDAQEDLLKNDIISVTSRISTTTSTLVVTFIIGLGLIILLAIILFRNINKSIKEPTHVLKNMALGILPEKEGSSNNELNEIYIALNSLSKNIKSASQFAMAIGDGKFNFDFQAASKDDSLGNSLLQMREKLRAFSEEEKKNSWSSNGLADLGKLIRNESDDTTKLYDKIISFIIEYLNVNQGALFIKDDTTETLDLAACYAYGRKKHIQESFEPGEGMVGQVYLEKKTRFLLDVPQNFVNITSGLGKATPNCVIVVPLIADDNCFGVLEIASFERLEEYQVNFLEELCKSVASTISTVRINTKTQNLLQETQQQAEEMKAQEEELRQNMEEMTATQEEMQRVQSRVEQTLEQAIDAVISIDDNKLITFFNKSAEEMFGFDRNEVLGKNVKMIVPIDHRNSHDDYINNNIATDENKVVGIGRVVEMAHRNGSKFDGFLSLSKIVSDSGIQYTAFIKDMRDIKELLKRSKL